MMLNGGEVGMAKFNNKHRISLAAAVDIAAVRYGDEPTDENKATWLAAEDAYNEWLQQFNKRRHHHWVVLMMDGAESKFGFAAYRTEKSAVEHAARIRHGNDRDIRDIAVKLIEWEDGEGL